MKKILCAALLSLLVLALACAAAEEIAIRRLNNIPVYTQATGHSRFIGWARAGAHYEVLGEARGAKHRLWLKIRLDDGQEGYLSAYATAPVETDVAGKTTGYVMIDPRANTLLYKNATDESARLAWLRKGETYPVLEENRFGWFRVALDDGMTGWVSGDNAFLYDEAEAENLRFVTVTNVMGASVREEPDKDSPRLTGVRAGETLRCVRKTDNGWYEIELHTGRFGFIAASLAEPAQQ